MNKLYPLAFVLMFMGCDDGTVKEDDTSTTSGAFCLDLSTSDDYRIEGTSSGAESGSFEGYLRTSFCEEFDDPDCVAFIPYTVENTDIGSTTQENGTTDNYGVFSGKGAEGNWSFVAGTTIDGNSCSSSFEFKVEAGRTTSVCPVLKCNE